MAKPKKVILGVTGSIAAYKSADIVRRLGERGFAVWVAMTKDAEHFISPLTLSSLACKEVYRDTFEADAWKMPHIALAQEADIFLIAPATAAIIGKLAHGIADNLLTCIALATQAKVVIAPAMNTQMYQHRIVQENCARLKALGVYFINPLKGKLACGTTGEGHIADVDTIVDMVVGLVGQD